ncbi:MULTISPECIES: transposase [Streptomyces]|uniref:Transposase n=2 Tax=Streptomyces TaxID=1883 RepID=A0ABV9J554_9ACTN
MCWAPCSWASIPICCGSAPLARSTRPCCWSSSAPAWPCLSGGAAALSLAADGVGALPVWRRFRPCTVVLDNASAHVAKAFKSRRDRLSKIGVVLFHLPPRSPGLNDIERVWRSAKYTRTTRTALTPASKPSAPPWTRR